VRTAEPRKETVLRRSERWRTWIAVALAAVATSACARAHSGEPPAGAGAVEGGILPAEEDYYAVDVVDEDHTWIVGSYGAVVLLREQGRKAELHGAPVREPMFCVSFRDPSNGLIGGRGGHIFRTSDGGRTWSAATVGKVTENVLAFARGRDPRRLWAVGPRGMLLQSLDDGVTWRDRSLEDDVTLNAVTFVDDREGWAVGEFGTILHTADGGETWNRSEQIEGLPPYAEDVSEDVALRLGIPPLRKDDLYLFDVAFVTADRGYAVAAGGFVLQTVDRGGHWTAMRAGTRNTLFEIQRMPTGGVIATGVLGTVVRSRTDGEGWVADEQLAHTLFTWIRGVSFSPDGKLGVAVGGKAAVLLSRDRGASWEALPRERLAAASSSPPST